MVLHKRFFVLYLLLIAICQSCDVCRTGMDISKSNEFSGVVISKYIDFNKRSTRTLVLQDSSQAEIYFYNDAYDYIALGDSVLKSRDSLKLSVIRNHTEQDFYPKCRGIEYKK